VTYSLVAGAVGSIGNYSVETQTVSATITQATQTINSTFSSATLRVGDSGVAATAFLTSSSGLTPTYVSLSTSICTISGSAITLIAIGTCTITATQSGNTNYSAAADLTDSATVLAAIVITPPSGGGGGGSPAPVVVIQKILNLAVKVEGIIATLTWSPITVATLITVKASDGVTFNLNAPISASKIEVSNLEPGFAYSATVTPESSIDSTSADTVSFALAPSAPKDLKVRQSSSNLVVNWTGAKGSAQYRVAIITPGKAVETVVTQGTEIEFAATPGLTYILAIVAVGDAQLISPVSEIVAELAKAELQKEPAKVVPEIVQSVKKTSTFTLKIYFKYAASTLDSKGKKSLQAFLQKVTKNGGTYSIKLVGFTQPTLIDPYSKSLSLNRAKTVATFLKNSGIRGKYVTSGAGQAKRNVPTSRYVNLTIVAKS
jgi:outer membrane protein OmpA-like peptidoglycan-associated protein